MELVQCYGLANKLYGRSLNSKRLHILGIPAEFRSMH